MSLSTWMSLALISPAAQQMCTDVIPPAAQQVCIYCHAGMCHTAYYTNTPYRIKRVFYRNEQIGPYYTIAEYRLFTITLEIN
jgi:hypothetical protein